MNALDAKESRPLEGGPSFPLSHRLYRAVWSACWVVAARWTPVPMHRWRSLLLRCFGADVHRTARVYPSARIWYPRNMKVDAHGVVGPRVDFYCMAPITIGSKAIVSQGAVLCAGTHDIGDPDFQLIARKIVIGSRAWVAAEAFIGPGVAVGEGAVVGARAVLFRDAAPLGVYAGNPATFLKHRELRDRAAKGISEAQSNV